MISRLYSANHAQMKVAVFLEQAVPLCTILLHHSAVRALLGGRNISHGFPCQRQWHGDPVQRSAALQTQQETGHKAEVKRQSNVFNQKKAITEEAAFSLGDREIALTAQWSPARQSRIGSARRSSAGARTPC